MSAAKGWICLHRKVTSWKFYRNPKAAHLFIHLLLSANYADSITGGISIKRGQLASSRQRLSKETGISERAIRTRLSRLVKSGEITVRPTSRFSVITICNYSQYQPIPESDQPTNQPIPENRPARNGGHPTENTKKFSTPNQRIDQPDPENRPALFSKKNKNKKNIYSNIYKLNTTRARARERESERLPTPTDSRNQRNPNERNPNGSSDEILKVIQEELRKTAFLHPSKNFNVASVPQAAPVWLSALRKTMQCIDLGFLTEAFSRARQRCRFLPKPIDVIECYNEVRGEARLKKNKNNKNSAFEENERQEIRRDRQRRKSMLNDLKMNDPEAYNELKKSVQAKLPPPLRNSEACINMHIILRRRADPIRQDGDERRGFLRVGLDTLQAQA